MLNEIIKPITKELKIFDSKYKDSLSSDVKLLILISDYILKNILGVVKNNKRVLVAFLCISWKGLLDVVC